MPESLTWSLSPAAGGFAVRLVGKLSEDTDFTPLLAQLSGPVAIDLGEVRGINSCGVREWVRFIAELSSRGLPLSLERCPPIFVHNMSEIANFAGAAEVRSIYLPYYCAACEENRLRLVPVSERLPEVAAEVQTCTCGQPMEFDDLVDSYFAFLQ